MNKAEEIVKNKENYKFRSGICTLTLDEVDEIRKAELKDFDNYTSVWDEEDDISEYAGKERSDFETLEQYLLHSLNSGYLKAFKDITYKKGDMVKVKNIYGSIIIDGPYKRAKTGGTVYLVQTQDGNKWVKDYDLK